MSVNWEGWVKFYGKRIKEIKKELLFLEQSHKAVKFLYEYNKKYKKVCSQSSEEKEEGKIMSSKREPLVIEPKQIHRLAHKVIKSYKNEWKKYLKEEKEEGK